MVKEQEIKYDGSFEEMIRLGLIDETGAVNTARREDYNIYMNKVWLKEHPEAAKSHVEYPSNKDVQEYLEAQSSKKSAMPRSFFARIFGRNK